MTGGALYVDGGGVKDIGVWGVKERNGVGVLV